MNLDDLRARRAELDAQRRAGIAQYNENENLLKMAQRMLDEMTGKIAMLDELIGSAQELDALLSAPQPTVTQGNESENS